MKCRSLSVATIIVLALAFLPTLLPAQVTRADYERSLGLRNELQPLALNLPERPSWIGKTSRFWYRKTVSGGFEFQVVDAATLAKDAAFDHVKLAAALAEATKEKVDAKKLPFQTFSFVDDERAVQFEINSVRWKCDLSTYTVTRVGPVERRGPRDPMSAWVRGPAPQGCLLRIEDVA